MSTPFPIVAAGDTAASPPNFHGFETALDLWQDSEHKLWDNDIFESAAFQNFNATTIRNDLRSASLLLMSILENPPAAYNEEFLKYHTAVEVCRDEALREALGKALEMGTFRNIRCLKKFRIVPQQHVSKHVHMLDIVPILDQAAQEKATTDAWKTGYQGEAHEVLHEHILLNSEEKDLRAYLLAIVQSTFCGKSRMIEQYSLKRLVIPLALGPNDSAFPPPDRELRDWLQKQTEELCFETKWTGNRMVITGFRQQVAETFYDILLISIFVNVKRIIASGILTLITQDLDITEEERRRVLQHLPSNVAGQFSTYMSIGRSVREQGKLRRKFYAKVVQTAESAYPASSDADQKPGDVQYYVHVEKDHPVLYSLQSAATELLEEIRTKDYPELTEEEEKTAWLRDPQQVIAIAFDEARQMGEYIFSQDKLSWSRLLSFRKTMEKLHPLPIWSLFLSTTGPLSQFCPPSESIHKRLAEPFCALGMDGMAISHRFDETRDDSTLENVTRMEFWVRLGRPYWAARYFSTPKEIRNSIVTVAAQKLLSTKAFDEDTMGALNDSKKLAILASRLALQFKTTTDDPFMRRLGVERELEQVEKHMRVCMTIDEGFNSILTVAPSEPTVVEAAAMLMRRPGFQSCSSLLSIFSNTPSISKGDRGEVVAALILLEAIDNCCFAPNSHTRRRFIAPVIDFMQSLLKRGPYEVLLKSMPSEGDRDGTFEEIFKDSNIYFTHFVKVLDSQVLTQEMLLRYIVRGAAVFCADRQQGVDLVVPFIYKGTRMTRTNVSILLCQVKNDTDYTRTPVRNLFDNMDPTKPSFKTFPDGGTLPIIRMVFALEAGLAKSFSDEPSNAPGHNIIIVRGNERPSPRNSSRKPTAFDLWCCGASSQTFSTIQPHQDNIYRAILAQLSKPRGITEIESSLKREAIMSQWPGATTRDESWSRFIKT
ncbi:hypothetical protein CERSUDRAFT_92863 [Gelatoporia subvermispora B]|uniref:Uncharacterized protein n=1 Tax=Ceriporiopsis subvermispora (strain B) TaxID=914234 RepID=M2R2R5_CERS8|nr:hypothetical protein CERSUDRAFT_92863 [Gelatoporia subvermispora B]